MHPASLVVIDDVSPNHPHQAARQRNTRVWTGDVWKIAFCLREYRPDLTRVLVYASPTGLLLVAGLSASDRTLSNSYHEVVKRFNDGGEFVEPPQEVLDRTGAVSPNSHLITELIRCLRLLGLRDGTSNEVRSALEQFRLP